MIIIDITLEILKEDLKLAQKIYSTNSSSLEAQYDFNMAKDNLNRYIINKKLAGINKKR